MTKFALQYGIISGFLVSVWILIEFIFEIQFWEYAGYYNFAALIFPAVLTYFSSNDILAGEAEEKNLFLALLQSALIIFFMSTLIFLLLFFVLNVTFAANWSTYIIDIQDGTIVQPDTVSDELAESLRLIEIQDFDSLLILEQVILSQPVGTFLGLLSVLILKRRQIWSF